MYNKIGQAHLIAIPNDVVGPALVSAVVLESGIVQHQLGHVQVTFIATVHTKPEKQAHQANGLVQKMSKMTYRCFAFHQSLDFSVEHSEKRVTE